MRAREVIAGGYLQPWLLGYALIGLVVSGIVPILIPLSVDRNGALAVGLVVAAFYLGTLASPVFGSLADRTGRQRLAFVASFPVIAVAAITFGLSDQTWAMFCCMLVAGAGAGAAQTTASVFIVEGRPHSEWADRMGWMRLAFGVGQVTGLAVAASFAHHVDTGWTVVGVAMFVGAFLGSRRLPELAANPRRARAARPRARLALLKETADSRFGVFLGFWLFAMIGLMSFYNVVPLVLRAAFGTSPSTTSLCLLAGSAAGAALYPVCGPLCDRFGSAYVLMIGFGVTLIAFAVLAVSSSARLSVGAIVGGVCLIAIAAVYPLQYIGATLQAAELAPGGEGAAMGLFNSGVAAGAVIGAIAPAFLARAAGYAVLPWFSFAAMIVAAVFGGPSMIARRRRSRRSSGPTP